MDYGELRMRVDHVAAQVRKGELDFEQQGELLQDAIHIFGHTLVDIAESLSVIAEVDKYR